MSFNLPKPLLLGTLFLQLSFICLAQGKIIPNRTNNYEDRDKIKVEECLVIASQLLDDAYLLEPKGEQIEFLIKLSDVIWDWDKDLAKRSLTRSANLTTEVYKQKDNLLKGDAEKYDAQALFLRMINVAEKHDAVFAKQITQQRDSILGSANNSSNKKQDDPLKSSSFLLLEAAQIIKKDERRAENLFMQSVSFYVTQSHFSFLTGIRKQNSNLADRLFAIALTVLNRRELREANEVLILASYLFSPIESVGYENISGYNSANTSSNLSASPKNPALAKQYLELLFRRLNPSETVPADVVYRALENLLPKFQSLTPELINYVHAKNGNIKQQLKLVVTDKYEKERNANQSDEETDVKSKLQKAEETKNEGLRDLQYFNLIDGHFLRKNDFATAYSLVEKLTDNDLRQQLRDYVHTWVIQASAKQQDIDAFVYDPAYNKIKDPLLKTLALCEVANTFLKHKKNDEASLLLEQAMSESDHIKVEQDRLQAMLVVAFLYLNVNQNRAFEISKETFRSAGKTEDFDIRRANFSLQITVYGLRNELSLPFLTKVSLLSMADILSKENSTETFSICQTIEKKNRRLWTTLAAINRALSEISKTSKVNKQ